MGVQNDMGPSSPPQMHLQRGYLKQGHVESRSKNVTTRSHLPLLWKHFLGPDMSGIPKVIRGLTKRNLVRVNYRGLLLLLRAKQRSRVTSQPYATSQPLCCGKHNGCFC